MKIAFVYDAVYPWVKGGAEKRIYEIGKRLADKGHEVHWFGIKWWAGKETIEHDGITLHGVCESSGAFYKRCQEKPRPHRGDVKFKEKGFMNYSE